MTRSETEQLLRGPARNEVHRAIVWVPKGGGRRVSSEIKPGEPEREFFSDDSMDGTQAVWLTETGLIAVDFGQDDRLRRKYYSDVHVVGSPNVLDWLSSMRGRIRKSLGH
ncbi:hypothetical protein [Tautonia plasticadhaerens]|nr:hypothetical protein [Tautonia plasticadhaerens]